MLTKSQAGLLFKILRQAYPDAKPELNFNSAFELMIAVMLSAQCTDKRVNIVTGELFKKYNTPKDFAEIKRDELERLIYSCGFYKNKAKNIIAASRMILTEYNGQVPDKLEELVKLDGVGRKTANVIYSVYFKGDAIAVDTHVFRLSKRLGLSSGNSPLQVEKDLMNIIDKDKWSLFHHLLIYHGRNVCKSAKPNCVECCLKNICEYNIEH